jgi:hypothetical protein
MFVLLLICSIVNLFLIYSRITFLTAQSNWGMILNVEIRRVK